MITPRRERGASALLLTSALLLLMGMAAIAIDLGAGFNERRQDQSAADAAALAAGLQLVLGRSTDAAVDEAKALVDTNLGISIADPSLSSAWADCMDPEFLGFPGEPEDYDLHPDQPCVSFETSANGFVEVRVRVPTQSTATSFGRVLGVATLDTTAIGVARVEPLLQNGAFPSSVFLNATGGDTACIKSTAGGLQGSCGDPDTGSFGDFNPYFYFEVNPSPGPTECASGDAPGALGYVMATGIDHPLGTTLKDQGTLVNGSDCPDGPLNPHLVNPGGGYSPADITNGLVTGGTFDSTDFSGRLAVPSSGMTVFDQPIDNTPLWSYMTAALAAAADIAIVDADSTYADYGDFSACSDAEAASDTAAYDSAEYADAEADLALCLREYAENNIDLDAGIFGTDLYDSPRLTVVPRFWEDVAKGSNNCCYSIKDFVPIYFNALWTPHSSKWDCDGVFVQDGDYCMHKPGWEGKIDRSGGGGKERITSADAIVLTCEMLPRVDEPRERCKKIETPDGDEVVFYSNLFLVR